MEISVQEGDATLVVLRGKLDREAAAAAERQFNDLAASRKLLVFDLSGVSYVASMGMRLFLLAGKAIAAQGGKMALMAPLPEVAGVLKTAGIDTAIPVRASLADALAAFARP
ncbi:MAG TPA: STAS domain-containing protein [Stellaceae bacterium]|jgi:anti-anti-sigma factor|nr:STAS domain-containing protein [Stellaceae bacterium]